MRFKNKKDQRTTVCHLHKAPIRARKFNRLGSVVKWLKESKLIITNKPEDKTDIIPLVKKLRTILHPVPAQRLKIFTDGSTQMKGRKSENSGFGIVVMDEKGRPSMREAELFARMGITLSPR